MFGFLLALVILDGLLLTVIVLLQAGKGDGLAAMGGSGSTVADGVMGGRQAATLLTKATWTTGGLFLGLLLVLSVMSSRAQTPTSILQQEFSTEAPAPLLPGAIDPNAPPPADAGTGSGGEAGTAQPPASGAPDTTG